MKQHVTQIKRSVCAGLAVAGIAVMSGCAVIPAANIKPGASNVAQVEQSMGKPDMTWRNHQGKIIQAAYSDQPASFTTFMVYFNDQGVVTGVDQVMNNKNFAKIQKGMDGNQVHRILGPERSTDHFAALHQVDWNYGYCSDNDGREVFSVSFDDKTMRVNGSVVTPDPLFSLGDNEEARCQPYIQGESYARWFMENFMKNLSGANVVPEPLYQLSGYELDLMKCCCYGWINACSLGFNLWQQQMTPLNQPE